MTRIPPFRAYVAILAVFTVAGCAHAPAKPSQSVAPSRKIVHTVAAAPAAVKAQGPWKMLREGRIKAAAQVFRTWRASSNRRQEGLAGLLAIARVRANDRAIPKLLGDVDAKDASPRLLMEAAKAAAILKTPPSGSQLLLGRACRLKPTPTITKVDIEELCSDAALFRATDKVEQCARGCDQTTGLPLYFAANQPAVMASVNGHQPAPFIIDTGASTSLVTKQFANKWGIKPVPNSAFRVYAAGGWVTGRRALVTLQTGAVEVKRVPVLILDLPIGSIAGIISPQASWSNFAVAFDFRKFTLTLSPKPPATAGLATLPFLRSDRNPILLATVGGRPRRGFMLDTGAYQTVLFDYFDKLTTPVKRGRETLATGAGGTSARAWTTSARFKAVDGPLTWTVNRPTIVEQTHRDNQTLIRPYGLIGMDFLMGRRLVEDTPGHKLLISKAAELSPWKTGDKAVWEVSGPSFAKPFKIYEEVVSRSNHTVTLDVRITRQGMPRHFRVQVADTWKSRGEWLITRHARGMWDVAQNGKTTRVPARQMVQRWLPAFVSFATTGKHTHLAFTPRTIGGKKVSCTTVSVDAVAQKRPARLFLTKCPEEIWRTREVELRAGRNGEGKILYRLRRVGR